MNRKKPTTNRKIHPNSLKNLQHGRPGPGRPKGLASYIQQQTRDGLEIVDVMLTIMRTSNRANLKVDAATWLADRGFGKPVQAVQPVGEDGHAATVILKWPDE